MRDPSSARSPTLPELAAATAERPVSIGPYDVTGLLGRGGMGEVFEAVHRQHGVQVALTPRPRGEPLGGLAERAPFARVCAPCPR